ncbi:MAG: MoaD/ThiS family protein [Hyphomicrobiaceae bacterium]
MVLVKLGGPLMSAAGGATEFKVEASNIREMLERLGRDYPNLKPVLDKGVSVAVNGHVFRGDWQRPIPPGAEVFILPPLQGG